MNMNETNLGGDGRWNLISWLFPNTNLSIKEKMSFISWNDVFRYIPLFQENV